MKNILSSLTLFGVMALALSGCLKDKGFDNNEYGINNPGGSPPAVGFADGKAPKTAVGLNATSSAQTIDVILNYTGAEPPSTDITVGLALDNSLVTAYNTSSGDNLTLAPAGSIVVPATVVIPAGQRFIIFKISVPSAASTVFNPSLAYGAGIKITSASNNVRIAGNLKSLVLNINIKNKFDGRYSLVFSNYHPSLNTTYAGGTTTVEMRTSGPNSVKIWFPLFGDFLNPAILGGSLTAFGAQSPEYTIDPVTNKVTVQNSFAGAVTFYTMKPGFDSRYEPGPPQKIICRWGYSYVAGDFALGASRDWTQNFTYLGPR